MEDWGARPHRLCDWECGSEGRIRGTGEEASWGGSSCIRGREEEGGGKYSGERGLPVGGFLFVICVELEGVMGKTPQDRAEKGVSLPSPSWGARGLAEGLLPAERQ